MYMYNVMYNVMYTCSTTQWRRTALHYASEGGHHETVQLLLEKGADPNVQDMVREKLLKSSPVMCTFIHCINTKLLAINFIVFLTSSLVAKLRILSHVSESLRY